MAYASTLRAPVSHPSRPPCMPDDSSVVDVTADAQDGVPRLVDHLFRHQAGQVVSTLTRIFGPQHLQLAEDVVQDTMIKALRSWTYRGIPENPGAWIMQVARNGALDALRRERTLRDRQAEIAGMLDREMDAKAPDADVADHELRDDELRMIFICCHPAIPPDARVALTLKTVGGFGVSEIARAFLVSEPTIAQRLVRAKHTIRREHIPFEMPGAADLTARLDSALDVLYGLFNEGYSAHRGEDLIRHELCGESIRLAAMLAMHPVCDRPKVHALLSLLLLQASRLPARTDDQGDLITLEEQDCSRWDRAMIGAAVQELASSARGGEISVFHLEANIAATHALSSSYEETAWEHILDGYDALLQIKPSPIVQLNRVVALAMVHGEKIGLAELDRIEKLSEMREHYLLHATRADLWRRQGQRERAAAAYQRALELTANEAERRFLERRMGEVRA
jgi:RNA polymerase sigma factor (sigma-70 family)